MNPPTYSLPDEHSYAQASGIGIWSLEPGPQLLNPFMYTIQWYGVHTHRHLLDYVINLYTSLLSTIVK